HGWHRGRREHRPPGRRQDRDGPELPGCVVLRVRAPAHDVRVGRLPPGRDPDAERGGLPPGVRGIPSGRDLARLHVVGAGEGSGPKLPRRGRRPTPGAAGPRPGELTDPNFAAITAAVPYSFPPAPPSGSLRVHSSWRPGGLRCGAVMERCEIRLIIGPGGESIITVYAVT